jgi:hypothetical protein
VREGKAVATPVRLGTRGTVQNDAWVEVVAGVAEGAMVLTGGVGLVRDGTPVKTPPAEAANAATPVAASAAR